MERKLNNSSLLAVIASVCVLLFANYSWGGSSSRGGHYGHSIRPMNGHHGYYKYGQGHSYYGYRHGKKHRYNKHRYGKMPYNYRHKYSGRITSNFSKDYNGRDKGYKKNPEQTYKHSNKKHKNSKANGENYKGEMIEKDWFR
jgi:hypothetical protein